eukprot:CAMPEP_0194289306 /NCGR_PEP_ID=MMETSP0169-20130528/38807_1 /TAXON_ID=218684 /ORGANISM="Corethron pennatum, Strain L29A3" /LENGTH=182 /DNA_ID=CAMNT_0039036551 /DNA_START=65 /DNA_END=613 /DNA_ORIENTATION=+
MPTTVTPKESILRDAITKAVSELKEANSASKDVTKHIIKENPHWKINEKRVLKYMNRMSPGDTSTMSSSSSRRSFSFRGKKNSRKVVSPTSVAPVSEVIFPGEVPEDFVTDDPVPDDVVPEEEDTEEEELSAEIQKAEANLELPVPQDKYEELYANDKEDDISNKKDCFLPGCEILKSFFKT